MAERRMIPPAVSGDARSVASAACFDPEPARRLIAKHEALTYPYRCTFGGARLVIEQTVFCPTLTNASPLLLRGMYYRPGERVLDVFSGSGAFGIIAAMKGAQNVVTVDISDSAVACATSNAELNGVSDRVEVRKGTLGECVAPDETFDLIIANPPLLPGQPTDRLSAAIFDPGLQATLDLVAALPTHLAEGGRCSLITSDVLGRYGYDIGGLCTKYGLVSSTPAGADLGYESYAVHEITR